MIPSEDLAKSSRCQPAGLWSCFDFSDWVREIQEARNAAEAASHSLGSGQYPFISGVVCAYNEEKTLQSVISGLPESPQIDEVIIVDDGSTDSTAEILQHLDGGGRLHSLRLPVNRGKGYAMAAGASLALGEVILFVDADLHNWNSAFAHQMIKPLLDGQARMVIGYPLRDWDAWENVDRLGTLHWLAGQRTVWRSDLQPLLDDLGGTRFGVETLLNLYYLEKRYSVQLVPLQGLHHPVKLEKAPVLFALGGYARAAFEILRTMALHRRLAWDLVMKA